MVMALSLFCQYHFLNYTQKIDYCGVFVGILQYFQNVLQDNFFSVTDFHDIPL